MQIVAIRLRRFLCTATQDKLHFVSASNQIDMVISIICACMHSCTLLP